MNLYAQWAITAAIFLLPLRLVCTNRIPPSVFYSYAGVLLLIAVILPLIFYFSLFLQRGVLYFYFVDRPEEGSLEHPDKFGLDKTRNFYLANEDITLGVWHILPASHPEPSSEADWDATLSSGEPVVLYVHGNLGSRATEHRLLLYKTLQALDYHVITFDYRCFGDSTYGTPHERAVVSDCLAVARWLRTKAKDAPVFLYGHSLGAGNCLYSGMESTTSCLALGRFESPSKNLDHRNIFMTTSLAAQLAQEGYETKGVILEAPFDNMPSEIRVHPFGRVFRIFPWYNFLFSSPYYSNGEDFCSSKYIMQFSAPIMILHAEDDGIIPSFLGEKLYRLGERERPTGSGPMSLFLFGAERGFGHAELCKAPETPRIIRDFVEKYKNEQFFAQKTEDTKVQFR